MIVRSFAVLALLAAVSARAGEVVAVVEDSAGKPVADAVVFAFEHPGNYPPPAQPAVMDQFEKQFTPHVLPIMVGTKVRFPNKDQFHHHVYSFSKVKQFEVPLYKGEQADAVLFDKPGIVKLGCNIHDWMLGFVIVVDNPYFARTGADGRAVISDVPEGKYRFAVWSERLKGSVDDTAQAAGVGKGSSRLQFRPTLGPARKRAKPAVESY